MPNLGVAEEAKDFCYENKLLLVLHLVMLII